MNEEITIPKTKRDGYMLNLIEDVVILDKAVERLEGSIKNLPPELAAAISPTQDLIASHEVRAEKVYSQILDASANIEKATEAIAGAAGLGVRELNQEMSSVTKNTNDVLLAMIALRGAVEGENGMSQKLHEVQGQFGEKLWILDKAISALSNFQVSKLAKHQKALSSVQNILGLSIAFAAGFYINHDSQKDHFATQGKKFEQVYPQLDQKIREKIDSLWSR